jgi:hypothetical protein
MYSIGITGARWKTTSYPKYTWEVEKISEVTFRGIDSEKAKFIFELRGGCDALNAYLEKAFNELV